MPEPIDPVVRFLLKSPLTPAQRRSASEAFSGAANEDDLQEKMLALDLPKNVRAELWDLKVQAPPQPSSVNKESADRFCDVAVCVESRRDDQSSGNGDRTLSNRSSSH